MILARYIFRTESVRFNILFAFFTRTKKLIFYLASIALKRAI